MAKVVTGYSWSNEQITPALLNQMWTSSTFNSSAVDDSTTALSGGAVIVKDAGIVAAKLASNSVTTVKILDDNVTTAKILDDNVTTAKILDANVTTAKISNDAVTYDKVDTATQAEMEGSSSAGVCVPDILKHHPGIAKAYGRVDATGSGANTLQAGSYNVASVAQSSADSDFTRVTLTNAMDNTNYTVVVTQDSGRSSYDKNATATVVSANTFDVGTNEDGQYLFFVVYGKLA
tara:strand:- start:806 stop:1507 length:702 start_codon:yes stop_codon:yes gene_type:complete